MSKCKRCQKELIRREGEYLSKFLKRNYCGKECYSRKKEYKECVICGSIFEKDINTCRKDWNKKKYCSYKCKSKGQEKPPKKYNCDWCGKEMQLTWKDQRRKETKFCSRHCSTKYLAKLKKDRGDKGGHWKGGRIIDKTGYVSIWMPEHPYPQKKGYIFEHRLVMEKKIERYLRKNELVYHINGVKDDNRIENLSLKANDCDKMIEKLKYELCSCGSRLYPSHYIEMNCDYCGKKYKTKKCVVRHKKYSNKYNKQYCSAKCGAKSTAIERKKDGTILKGKTHPNWKGGRIKQKDYVAILMPNHPYCGKKGYVLEHRYVMEQQIGRYLKPEEIVHHINGKKTDNRIENLFLFKDREEHNEILHIEVRKETLTKLAEELRKTK